MRTGSIGVEGRSRVSTQHLVELSNPGPRTSKQKPIRAQTNGGLYRKILRGKVPHRRLGALNTDIVRLLVWTLPFFLAHAAFQTASIFEQVSTRVKVWSAVIAGAVGLPVVLWMLKAPSLSTKELFLWDFGITASIASFPGIFKFLRKEGPTVVALFGAAMGCATFGGILSHLVSRYLLPLIGA